MIVSSKDSVRLTTLVSNTLFVSWIIQNCRLLFVYLESTLDDVCDPQFNMNHCIISYCLSNKFKNMGIFCNFTNTMSI